MFRSSIAIFAVNLALLLVSAPGARASDVLDSEIQNHAQGLQAKCDEKRIELKRDFLQKIFTPVQAEVLPGAPFSSLRISGPASEWKGRAYRVQLRYEGKPGKAGYQYASSIRKIPSSASGVTQEVSFEDVIESQIPYECRIFLTGLNKSTLYAIALEPPAFKSWDELTDPNRALKALDPPHRVANQAGPQVYSLRQKII